MINRPFNSDMLRLARDIRDMTQGNLAKRAGVSQAFISRMELTNDAAPEMVERVSAATEFPIEFFFQDERYSGLGLSTIFFRKKSTSLQKNVRRLQAEVNLRRIATKALLRDVHIQTKNEFRAYDIEETTASPEEIARMVRGNWSLPAGPIINLTDAIEGAGGIVFRFPFGTTDIDAISQWPDDGVPLFFVNSEAPADRIKFSLAHELGHMAMHRSASESMEDEANRFASEFLMPSSEIKQYLFGIKSLATLASMKPYWRVSIASLLRRAHSLECITPFQYKRFCVQYSQLGYRRGEPNPLPHDTPKFIEALIDVRHQRDGTIAELARQARMSEGDFRLRFVPSNNLRITG
ncbi:MAG: ImmA/IrrE family metallo-endopeptidase [Planctomycetes bacterium]|nr:ImmA/IrrE family metallo-endopeptidase [Planctomycetota bacterium]